MRWKEKGKSRVSNHLFRGWAVLGHYMIKDGAVEDIEDTETMEEKLGSDHRTEQVHPLGRIWDIVHGITGLPAAYKPNILKTLTKVEVNTCALVWVYAGQNEEFHGVLVSWYPGILAEIKNSVLHYNSTPVKLICKKCFIQQHIKLRGGYRFIWD